MEFEKSSIERLKRTLYSRNDKVVPKEKRTPVQGHEIQVPTDWGSNTSFNLPPEELEHMSKPNNSFFNKFLLWSVGFFILSLSIALFIFFGGINMISSNNLDVQINAPSSISSGEELLVNLSIINANRADLNDVSLYITYPDGAQSVGVMNKTLVRDTISLGTIATGATKDYSVRALLAGEKDSVKTFTFKIEYKVKGSNAIFSKEKTYDVLIGSSPLLLDVSYPKEVNSGQDILLTINITSNSSVVVKDPIVKIEYPYGFTYTSSNMAPLRDNSVWNIGDLKNGDKKTLLVHGTLVGQNLEDRSFRVSAGTLSSTKQKDFDTALVASLATIGIRKSFFDLSVSPSDSGVHLLGQSIPLSIKWQNTLPDKMVNNHIEVSLSGNAFDRSSVGVSEDGFYRSYDNTVVWDKNSNKNLQSIMPGDTGEVRFNVSSFANSIQMRSVKNPNIIVRVTMTGDRAGIETGAVTSTEDYVVKLASTPTLITTSNRDGGPFTNTGPIPPKADKETTYTITWNITNTTNDLKNTTVSTILPSGISWKEQISPNTERISYNPDTRVVLWNVGNVSSGAGFTSSPRQVSFQIGLTPSVSQIGSIVTLTSETNFQTIDTYIESKLQLSQPQVTTHFADRTFKFGNDIVVK